MKSTKLAYEWLFSKSRRKELAERFKRARLRFEDLNETVTTFKTQRLFDDPCQIPTCAPAMIRYLGAWKVPPRYPNSDKRGKKWVNPHAKWAPKYTDVGVKCECGAVRISPEFRADTNSHYIDEKYSEACSDDCPADQRMLTKAEIWQNRRRILEIAGQNLHSTEMVARRFDVDENHVKTIARNLGYDGWKELRRVGYQRRRATWVRLAERYNMKHKEIGEVFGVPRSTVSDHIRGDSMVYQDESAELEVVKR